MTDVRAPRELATLQDGVIARWQLVRAGLTEAGAEWWVRHMQPLGDGVFLAGLAQPTQRQRWWAAVLSHPGTVLSHASAAACHELRPVVGVTATVTRVGNRGRQHSRGLLVSYSLTLGNDITEHNRLPITTVERTIIDLWPSLSARARSRMLREGLRLGSTTAPRMLAAIRAHRRRRGVASLRAAVEQLGGLQARPLPLRSRGVGGCSHRRRWARGAERERARCRRRGGPQLAGGTPHRRARRPELPRLARRGHPQDEGLAGGGLRRPAPPHRRRLPRARTASGPRAADERRSYPVITWEDRRSTLRGLRDVGLRRLPDEVEAVVAGDVAPGHELGRVLGHRADVRAVGRVELLQARRRRRAPRGRR